MATVNSRDIVDAIIENDGHYEDDPVVVRIVQYNNMFNGDLAYGLIYEHEDPERYHKSPACHNPTTIWQRGVGLMNHG
jgi:hypothetical protein